MLLILSLVISACSTLSQRTQLPKISDNAANKYIDNSLKEYNNIITNNPTVKNNVKWMQARNKKEACKVYLEYRNDNDSSLDDDYKIFWDGKCKNGYAYGLGREFVLDDSGIISESLAIYKKLALKPTYYIESHPLQNTTIEGDINNHYTVQTTTVNDDYNFNISYIYGYLGFDNKPNLINTGSPFSDSISYMKQYPNFGHRIDDTINDEFSSNRYTANMYKSNGQMHGFWFSVRKNGAVISGESTNGKTMSRLLLPKSYFDKIGLIINEIKQAGTKALKAQEQALLIKKKYKRKICKPSVKVTFMDNYEYKSICRANPLIEKFNTKMAEVNNEKQRLREQQFRNRQIDAQNRQANRQMEFQRRQVKAAERQASAAEESAGAAQRANNMTQTQNLNKSLQQMIKSGNQGLKSWSNY